MKSNNGIMEVVFNSSQGQSDPKPVVTEPFNTFSNGEQNSIQNEMPSQFGEVTQTNMNLNTTEMSVEATQGSPQRNQQKVNTEQEPVEDTYAEPDDYADITKDIQNQGPAYSSTQPTIQQNMGNL